MHECGARIESAASTRVMHVCTFTCEIHDWGKINGKPMVDFGGMLNRKVYSALCFSVSGIIGAAGSISCAPLVCVDVSMCK